MKLPSFSKLHLAMTCPASMVIAPVIDVGDTAPASRGRALHSFLERLSQVRAADPSLSALDARDVVLAEFERAPLPDPFEPGVLGDVFDEGEARDRRELELAAMRAVDVEALPTQLAAEVAFAWDWRARRARELGRGIGRAYVEHGLDVEREIAGTVDLLGFVDRGPGARVVYVGDYKTGITRYPRPKSFAQTLIGALCASQLLGADLAHVELIYLDGDGVAWPVSDEIDSWDLDGFADAVERALDTGLAYEQLHAQRQAIPLVRGRHCRDCPSVLHCPATTALVRSSIEWIREADPPADLAGEAIDAYFASLVTPENVADLYHRVSGMRALLARISEQIETIAAREPIDLGDGTMLGRVAWQREKLDGDASADLLIKMYGEKAAAGAIKRTTSKEAVKSTIAAHKAKGEKVSTKKGDGVFDRFLHSLRAQGAVRVESGETVRPYKKKEQ